MGNKKNGNGHGTLYSNLATELLVGQYFFNGKRKSMYQRKGEKTIDFKKRYTKVINSLNENTYVKKNTESLSKILEHHIAQKHLDGFTSPRSYLKDKETLKEIENTCSDFINQSIQKITV